MQDELNAKIGIRILGVNRAGYDYANDDMTLGRDIPWLQDVDSDGDGSSDAWASWGVRFRDVVILDAGNTPVGTFNLTDNDLEVSDNYEHLQEMLVGAAVPEPGCLTLLAVAAAGLFVYGWRRRRS